MLYVFDKFDLITEESLEDMILEMPPERQEKVRKYKRIEDKKACALGYYLLCQGLKEEYGIEHPTLEYHEFGKPYLKEHKEIFFNISHTKHIAACVIANTEVGVDVEEVREYSPLLLDKILNEEEKANLKNDNDFFKYWTIKEAVCKCEGTGIANFDFQNIDYTKYDFDMRQYPQFNAYLTVCYRK
ncbi:MAG: 4'-phosphopantetheinyl transferase superfamily protein [Clostridia bacterium]|nr:4'-phosphopantetheinyl transferase superfamily protein [Clostridia bacterium]